MGLEATQSGSLGANVSTGSSHLSSPSTSKGSTSPSSPKLVTPNSQPQLGSGASRPGGASTRGQKTLEMMKEELSGKKIVGGMGKLNNRPTTFENVAAKMKESVAGILDVIGHSKTGQAMQITGTGLTTAGGITAAVSGGETFGIGAVVGLAISAVGAVTGGIGTMMENKAKQFAGDAEGLLHDQIGNFEKVAQNRKEQGKVIDLALGEEGPKVATVAKSKGATQPVAEAQSAEV